VQPVLHSLSMHLKEGPQSRRSHTAAAYNWTEAQQKPGGMHAQQSRALGRGAPVARAPLGEEPVSRGVPVQQPVQAGHGEAARAQRRQRQRHARGLARPN
jgi:hypothetical protein